MAKPNGGDAVKFEFEMDPSKETPGTYVFVNKANDAVVPQLYMKKFGFPKGAPDKKIKVTIEVLP